MRRQRALNLHVRPTRHPFVREIARCELPGTPRVLTLDDELIARSDRKTERRRRGCRPEPAEPAAAGAAQIEHTEVEAGRGFDEDRLTRGRRAAHAGAPEGEIRASFTGDGRSRARTKSITSVIASCSAAPAVLSTMTWRRASSLSMKSEGSRCRRVA